MSPAQSPEIPVFGHEDTSRLPPGERARLVEKVRVLYPRWMAIEAKIARCHEMGSFAAEPQCLLVVGPTGVGKTTLAASYALRYPRIEMETGVEMPVLHATIPTAATIKDLSEELLSALGDPRAGLGTTGQKTRRLAGFFRDCGTRLLILDETQHFVDRDSQRVLLNASNWLKTLVSDGLMSHVMALVRGATHLALTRGSERLELDLLAAAFDHRLAGRRRGLANPFVGELPHTRRQETHARPIGAANRRSKARAPRREKLNRQLPMST